MVQVPERFTILEEAGAGGMGTVYRARDAETGREVALKVLADTAGDVTRFALEAKLLSELDHPNIVRYVAHGIAADHHPFLAMEWLDGQSLDARLQERPSLAASEAVRIGAAIADALAHAHARGVVHRDVKPSNVLLTHDGGILLIDFGIAKSEIVDGLTRTGAAIGSVGYMSPEQASAGEVDYRTDLFSLGCVLHRCLSGRPPFGGADLIGYVRSLALEEAPPLAPAHPARLGRLVASLLAKDPERRPRSAAEVAAELHAIGGGADELAPTAEHPPSNLPTRPTPSARVVVDGAHGHDRTVAAPSRGAPAHNLDTDSLPSPAPAPAPRAPWPFLVTAVAVAAIASTALAMSTRARQTSPTGAPEGAPSARATSTATAAPPASARPGAHAVRVACREWAHVILHNQRDDGAFASDPHTGPSGWDTAQQLYAIAKAHEACDASAPRDLARGARALAKAHVDGGWHGVEKGNPWGAGRVNTPANAWALLAFKETHDETKDDALVRWLATARADVLAARRADGSFSFARQGRADVYATVMAAWALSETGSDRVPSAEAASAIDWLRRRVVDGDPSVLGLGVIEQIAWVLARGERRAPGLASKGGALDRAAREVLAHCGLVEGACTRSIGDTGRIAVSDGGMLLAFWHPWVAVAATELAREPTPLAPELRAPLAAVARWSTDRLSAMKDGLTAAPEYKLSEYLMAVAALDDEL